MATTNQNPDVYDASQKAHRPMVPGSDVLNPALVPMSARAGNVLQDLADGLYLGDQLDLAVYYVNSAGDDTAAGTKAAPWKTLDGALANLVGKNPNARYKSTAVLALQSGQAFTLTTDVNIYGGSLNIAFYGDAQYGDFNSAAVGTAGADPAVMSDLVRPTITPAIGQVNAQWKIAGFNVFGGNMQLTGVSVQLPAAPVTPSISLYSTFADFVRFPNGGGGSCDLYGSIFNITDTAAFWGVVGVLARARVSTLTQFACQFQVNATLINSTAATPAQLTARNNFIKFYADFAGNNQSLGTLSPTAQNSSGGSGLLNLMWSDTEALVVSTGKTNQATFPLLTNVSYGLRNYFTGLVRGQQQQPMNVITPRLF